MDLFTQPSSRRLIAENDVRYIPASLPAPQFQLKHLLSTRCGDYLYYLSGLDILAIHLPSSRRHLVKSLEWKPFCLDAAYGWVAVGGRHGGQCIFIQILRNDLDPSQPLFRHAEVDDLLSLDFNPLGRPIPGRTTAPNRRFYRRPKYVSHEHNVGEDIVNSIVIHKLPRGKEGREAETVAILANNDQTVSIVSLATREHLAAPEPYPSRMNRASISPDGNLLIAGGDDTRVFFHRRAFRKSREKDVPNWECEWEHQGTYKLPHAKERDACFATDFSPSGHVCVIATESGLVTLFSTAHIEQGFEMEDAIIGSVRSSRVNSSGYCRGAFRSMSFSPEPWDLLALTEHQGRVTIIDLRHALHSKQTLEIDPSLIELDVVGIEDEDNVLLERQSDIERRFLDSNEEAMATQDLLARLANDSEDLDRFVAPQQVERDVARRGRGGDPHRLSQSERSFLEAVSNRVSPADHSSASNAPFSVNYQIGTNRFLPSPSPWDSTEALLARSQTLSDWMRSRQSERPRTGGERQHQPRRRSSVVVSQANPSNAALASNTAPITTRSPNFSASPSRLPESGAENDEENHASSREAWQRIRDVLQSDNDSRNRPDIPTGADQDSRPLAETANIANSNQRAFTSRLSRGPADYDRQTDRADRLRALRDPMQRQLAALAVQSQRINTLVNLGPQSALVSEQGPSSNAAEDDVLITDFPGTMDPADGNELVGLGWSLDGRELFVASTEGIFRFRTNVAQRGSFETSAWL